MNSFAQTYLFGNTALDPERERKVAIYGRVSTQHEAQIDALGNQMQWYEDQLNYHPNWKVMISTDHKLMRIDTPPNSHY